MELKELFERRLQFTDQNLEEEAARFRRLGLRRDYYDNRVYFIEMLQWALVTINEEPGATRDSACRNAFQRFEDLCANLKILSKDSALSPKLPVDQTISNRD